jgi:hypothetical protein
MQGELERGSAIRPGNGWLSPEGDVAGNRYVGVGRT